MKVYEDKDLLETIKSDIKFLASFLPGHLVSDVEKGLSAMFYVTGTYEGDVELMKRVEEIYERYGIDPTEMTDAEEEDFVDTD